VTRPSTTVCRWHSTTDAGPVGFEVRRCGTIHRLRDTASEWPIRVRVTTANAGCVSIRILNVGRRRPMVKAVPARAPTGSSCSLPPCRRTRNPCRSLSHAHVSARRALSATQTPVAAGLKAEDLGLGPSEKDLPSPMHNTTTELPSRWQPDLFADQGALTRFDVATTHEIDSALDSKVPVFIGVSGGKDSQALAYRLCDYLGKRGHAGPRLLIHCHLACFGRVAVVGQVPAAFPWDFAVTSTVVPFGAFDFAAPVLRPGWGPCRRNRGEWPHVAPARDLPGTRFHADRWTVILAWSGPERAVDPVFFRCEFRRGFQQRRLTCDLLRLSKRDRATQKSRWRGALDVSHGWRALQL